MEIIVGIIMLLVILSFIMKLSYHGITGIAVLSLLAALSVGFSWEYASMQSKTQIADWLQQPALMLDMSVFLTFDVLCQVAFCVLMAKRLSGSPLRRSERVLSLLLMWLPGILIFPVLFAILVSLIFSMPGTDFSLIGWGFALAVLVIAPLLAMGLRLLLPEKDLRLELFFLINLLMAALGVVATVNGRTAVAGTNNIEWGALGGVIVILLIGSSIGFIIYRIKSHKKAKTDIQ